ILLTALPQTEDARRQRDHPPAPAESTARRSGASLLVWPCMRLLLEIHALVWSELRSRVEIGPRQRNGRRAACAPAPARGTRAPARHGGREVSTGLASVHAGNRLPRGSASLLPKARRLHSGLRPARCGLPPAPARIPAHRDCP